MRSDVLFFLKVRSKQLLHNSRLHIVSLRLAQLYEPVRVSRVARLATPIEVYTHFLAHAVQATEDDRGLCIAEFGSVELAFIDAGIRGIRVEIEGQPGRFEGVFRIWVCSFVEFDTLF